MFYFNKNNKPEQSTCSVLNMWRSQKVTHSNIHSWCKTRAELSPFTVVVYISLFANVLLLLMTNMRSSINGINKPGTRHSQHTVHPQMLSRIMRIYSKIEPVNQSENVRWLSAAVCLPTTPPAHPLAQLAVKPCEHHFPLIKFVYKGN